jgi:hypothetical protein
MHVLHIAVEELLVRFVYVSLCESVYLYAYMHACIYNAPQTVMHKLLIKYNIHIKKMIIHTYTCTTDSGRGAANRITRDRRGSNKQSGSQCKGALRPLDR